MIGCSKFVFDVILLVSFMSSKSAGGQDLPFYNCVIGCIWGQNSESSPSPERVKEAVVLNASMAWQKLDVRLNRVLEDRDFGQK